MGDDLDKGCHIKSETIVNELPVRDVDCPPPPTPLGDRLRQEFWKGAEGLFGSSAPTQEQARYNAQVAKELAAEDKVLAATQKFIDKNWTDPETRITALNQANILLGLTSPDKQPMKLDSQHAFIPDDMQKLTQFVNQVKHDNPGFKPLVQ
jgi:hypothetical protein